jgi:hypothetical protein
MASPFPDGTKYDFDADRTHVTLTIKGTRLDLDTREMEVLAQHLGYLRAAMQPEVPLDVPAGECPTIDIPRLALQATPDGTRIAMGVRTPAFGWIALLLDRSQAEGLGAHLTSAAASMKPAKPN